MSSKKTKYRNLILSTGYVESASISSIIVGCHNYFESVEEGASHFRDCLIEVAKQRNKDRLRFRCDKCEEELNKLGEDRFCSYCGKSLSLGTVNDEDVAEVFRSWFTMDLDEFSEWDLLEANGWTPSVPAPGPYIQIENFDSILSDWTTQENFRKDKHDPEDWKAAGRWWNTENIHYGTIKPDKPL